MPCEPAAEMRPTASRTNPMTRSTLEASPPPLMTATKMKPRPNSVASQPTTKSAGAERPSIVKVEAPGR
jgi:hypothetical protein